jgi:thiol:disulfide interchange protein DsbA
MPQLIRSGAFLFLSFWALSVQAQPREMIEGMHFETLASPLATRANEDVIEILDVFWYGCPQCREFEPMMTYYGGQIRGDLVMRRMPAVWNQTMRNHAQVYFTAVELGIAAQAHPAAFRYVQEDQLPLNTPEQAQLFFGSLGTDAAAFTQAWQSDKVKTEVETAEKETATAGMNHLPGLIVNGRFKVVRNASVQELTEVVIIANQLIALLRDERRPD